MKMRTREEIANSVSHGAGFVFALGASPLLIIAAASRGGAAQIVGSSIFAATMVLLYFASTWYHAVPAGRLKERLRVLDHVAIYLLIAGTYTPFTLGVLRGALGWTLFATIWGAAVVGICAKLLVGFKYPKLSGAMYLFMGWVGVVAIRQLWISMPLAGVTLLVAGGLLYTVGVVFFCLRRVPYAHFVWHLFVLGGSTCHFFAVLWYA